MKKRNIYIIIFILLLIILDQFTKILVINSFNEGDSLILINNFLKFYYIKNTGISFGLFSGKVLIVIFVTIFIMFYIMYEMFVKKNNKMILLSGSLILSGAIGNLIDRVFRGFVVDFISFTLFGKEMAVFNVADMLITFGVIVYLIDLLLEGKNEKNRSKRRK